jgi:quercetin dioxygenase-like cupin family protein
VITSTLDELFVAVPWGRHAPIRRRFGVGAFGINANEAAAGEVIVPDHTETQQNAAEHEELYFVHRGRARFTVDGTDQEVAAGGFVHVPEPASRRVAVALEDGTIVLAIGAKRGEAFRPSAWEWNAEAIALWDTGDHERIEAVLREGLAEHPEHPTMIYNLACLRSLAGRTDEALEFLREACAANPDLAENAGSDSDLDAIRDDPRFASAVAGQPEAGSGGA